MFNCEYLKLAIVDTEYADLNNSLILVFSEQINNPNFKGVEFDAFKNEAELNSFTLSPTKWRENTNAIKYFSSDKKEYILSKVASNSYEANFPLKQLLRCSTSIDATINEAQAGETYSIDGHNERDNLYIVHTICEILDAKRPKDGSYKEFITFVEDKAGYKHAH